MENKIRAIIFDVNETLLNLEPLKKSINKALQNDKASEIWFAQLLHYSLVENQTDSYHNFSEIAAAVFKMNAETFGMEFSDEKVKEILEPVKKLDAYPEVLNVLRELKSKGLKLIAFSNGKPEVLQEQLEFAGIQKCFDTILSVETCKKFKPHPDSYSYVLKTEKLDPEECLMVAAHGWDIAGATNAGMNTAFIKRQGKSLYPLANRPDFIMEDLTGLLNLS